MATKERHNTAPATEARRRSGYKRVLITFDERLLEELDEARAATPRSALIEALVREYLARVD